MTFWVLENKKHNYAKIHRGECGCCKDGQGPRPDHTGCWHGPFTEYKQALTTAKNIKHDVSSCKLCKPQPHA